MRRVFLLWAAGILILTSFGCNSDDEIIAGFNGDDKLSEGDRVPFLLNGVYPNPTEGIAMIDYQLAQSLHIQLRVYTEDWQEVALLVDGIPAAGRHEVEFNTHGLAGGVYYCVMEGGGHTQMLAMRIVK